MDEQHRKWRVLVDGQERLADHVVIQIPCQTIMENVGSEEKYHFLCNGSVEWDGNVATIN
jgi:protoporphyrinogen oxidase